MRRNLLFPILLINALIVSAAPLDWNGVPVIPDSYVQKIGKDGVLVAGETTDGSYFTYNTRTNQKNYYLECHGGMGNCIAENGRMVGSDKRTSKGVIMADGKTIPIPSLNIFPESYLHGITWDGSRLCGLLSNPALDGNFLDYDFNGQMYVPFYCDIDADGTIGQPVILDHPEKDFFNATPQFCSAVWISDDGKTIAGQVIDNTGFYMYPVVYSQGDDGEWSYSLPSESLFNMNNEYVPEYPPFEMKVMQVTDFMTPEEQLEFEAALADPDFEGSPYDFLPLFMTPEELEAYNEWYAEYQEYSWEYENVILVQYYSQLISVVQNSVFFEENSLALNPEGTMLASPQEIAYLFPDETIPRSFYIPYIFDLTEKTYRKVGEQFSRWNTNQLLSDGTLVVCTPNVSGYSPDSTPVHSAVLLPGSDEFIDVADWAAGLDPSWGAWMKEYLYHNLPVSTDEQGTWIYKDMYVTGLVAVSDDAKVLSGGVDGWSWDYDAGMYFSYILEGPTSAGIEQREAIDAADSWIVYNMQGGKVMTTVNKSDLQILKGFYIVNGKKILFN